MPPAPRRPPAISLATVAAITGLTALQHLDLSGAHVTAAGCRLLAAALTNLRRLQLAATGLTDDGAAGLVPLRASLTDLNASQNHRLGDAGAAVLCRLTGLRNLSMCDTAVGGGGCRRLAAELTDLECVALVGSRADAAAVAELAAALPAATVKWRPLGKK